MPKPRTKRGAGREEKKRKLSEEDGGVKLESKRQRRTENETESYHQAGDHDQQFPDDGAGEKEYFGMLADDEQEYFRRADEMLELNQFPSSEERDIFLESVYREARGKELKLASSQSCSRLMERLIQLANTSQKKSLFEAFGGHYLSLVQHRFASHCCEALFLRSAGVVTQELAGFVVDTKGANVGDQQPEYSMENLFLATLDELEGSLGHLITDRFASHTLRVLLLVLSGMPLEHQSAKSLVKSKKKEHVTVVGSGAADEPNQGHRQVPETFLLAANKIIRDTTSNMDATSLRVLSKHPIGNPTLQLLLELDLTLNKGEKESSEDQASLLQQLLPGAPKSLADASSEASEFVNGMVYDQIGSRLIETLITHAPGKVFRALNQNVFLPRIQGYVRNDISCYPAIKVLNRLGKDDLVQAVEQIAPTVPQLVAKARYNVLAALFERCAARQALDQIKTLTKGLKEGCGSKPETLVMTLCSLPADEEEEKKKKKDVQQLSKNEYAIQSHGAKLLTTLLSIPGPSKAVQESLSALSAALLVRLATTSMPTVTLLTTAISTPSANSVFQKSLVNTLLPHVPELSTSQFGHNLVNALVEIPGKGKDYSIPHHMKDSIISALAEHEPKLRDSWMGRSVWRTWKGDMWKTRRRDWKNWLKDIDEQKIAAASATGANGHQGNGEETGKKHGDHAKSKKHRKDNDNVNAEEEKAKLAEPETKDLKVLSNNKEDGTYAEHMEETSGENVEMGNENSGNNSGKKPKKEKRQKGSEENEKKKHEKDKKEKKKKKDRMAEVMDDSE